MWNDVALTIIGLIGLFWGGNALVRGASRLATSFHISPLIIGLTIVAIGTSMPELLVGATAALQGESGLAVGNVLGSNIANIGLILGVSGVITPIIVHVTLLRREIPIMIIVSIFAYLIVLDGQISRLDGVLLIFGFMVFTGYFMWLAQSQRQSQTAYFVEYEEPKHSKAHINRWVEMGYLVAGIGALVIGSNALVTGAVSIARYLGVSELVIGITMVAIGTSLPELATSLMAAFKREADIVLGNVVGSNIANILLILGVTAFILPIPVDSSAESVSYGVMIGFAVMLLPFAWNQTLGRRESAIFLGAYLAFVMYTFLG